MKKKSTKSGRSILKIQAVIFLFFIFQIEAFAQPQTVFPRLEPDPKAQEFHRLSLRNRAHTWEELAEISLWASGDTRLSNMENIRRAVESLHNSGGFPPSGRERAEFILSFLHANYLRSYSLLQTGVDTVFSTGRFNCVSSSVLYMIFCQSAGINTSGVMTRDHAFVIVHIGNENIDVETTNSFGFDPGNRREFHDQFGRLTGFTYVPAQNYRDRQTINQIELISLILSNRIAEHDRQNRFAESVPVAIDRAALLVGSAYNDTSGSIPSGSIFADPKNELMDRLLNYSSMLIRAGREEDCLRWITAASAVYPHETRWQEAVSAAVNNNLIKLTRANRLPEARRFLEGQRNVLTQANFFQFESVLVDSELTNNANRINSAVQGEEVINTIIQERTNGRISENRACELITFSVQKIASALSAGTTRDWRAAVVYIEAAIIRFGTNRELEQALRTYRNNLAADYHNRFAAEWNRGNFEEARHILNEGLAEFPENRQLLNNRDIVERRNR